MLKNKADHSSGSLPCLFLRIINLVHELLGLLLFLQAYAEGELAQGRGVSLCIP